MTAKKPTNLNRKRRVAFFDIDGTIFRSSLLIEITEELVHEGIFPQSVSQAYARAYKRWLDRKGPYEEYIGAVIRAYERAIRGVSHDRVATVARRVVAFRQNRVYRFTRDLVRDLRRRGYFLVAISKSPRETVSEFCTKLGFNKIYGMIYGIDAAGRFTGRKEFWDLISDKAKILRRAVERNDLTLRGSIGVGDTESDIRFLELVDRPICFNPNRRLYDCARRRGWEIAIERKDVIHHVRAGRHRD